MKSDIYKRVFALVVDSVFVNLLANLIINNAKTYGFTINYEPFTINYSVIILCFLAYFIVFDYLNDGQTIGKAIFEIRVNRLTLKNRFKRSGLKVVSIIFTPITILLYMVKKELFHEYILDQ